MDKKKGGGGARQGEGGWCSQRLEGDNKKQEAANYSSVKECGKWSHIWEG